MAPLPHLADYDRILVAFSGGKDSLACLLHLFDLGAAPDRIELHHHDVDGGQPFMDWPCTSAYCAALAAHLGVPLYRSWREGGFRRELDRRASATAPVVFETPSGHFGRRGGHGPPGTRGRFPQLSADLRVRWCSSALKIEVLAAAIRGQPRFDQGRTLVVTGERAQESPARARYATFEPHRTATRGGRSPPRRVDHWRPLHDWNEAQVWSRIEQARLRAHPAYRLGWSRLSCMSCIFLSADAWATLAAIAPENFATLVAIEAASPATLRRGVDLRTLAARGRVFDSVRRDPGLVTAALDASWPESVLLDPWRLPAGAFRQGGGPS